MANLKWYDQCVFCLIDTNSGATHTPVEGEDESALKVLVGQGWEDDPAIPNSGGWIYVRREMQLDRTSLAERLQRVERGDLEKLGKLGERVEELEKLGIALSRQFARLDKAQTEQTADVEVADPALLKATVASLDELQGKHTHLNEVYESFRQELDQVVGEQTEVGLRHMDGFKTALRSMEDASARQGKDHASLQRDYGSLTIQIKDLQDKLRDAESKRQALGYSLTALTTQVAEKIAGAEGGVVKAMETAMPGTRWEVKIEGGER